ncbi:MAG: DEAD/DEAH box helicase family protein, partial [Candidatus Hydrogenedentota bacterium]
MEHFKLVSDYEPQGDQPQAIQELVDGLNDGLTDQTLMGVTGSGKTYTIANVIQQINRPTLIMAPNKILAAQLYKEFKMLFPENAVEYFVSYYDYYQPEAYVPTTDTFIEKDSSVNDEIDKMRHSATRAVLSRRDCIIVASVSCIYGIGSPETYSELSVELYVGDELSRDDLIAGLIAMQYERADYDFHRGTFRVRGDIVDVFPKYEADIAIRIEYFGDEIEGISEIDPLRGVVKRKTTHITIYPGSHYATTAQTLEDAIKG